MFETHIPKRKGKLIHIRLSEKMHTRLKIHVAENHTTFQDWTVQAIRNTLRRQWLVKFRDKSKKSNPPGEKHEPKPAKP